MAEFCIKLTTSKNHASRRLIPYGHGSVCHQADKILNALPFGYGNLVIVARRVVIR